MPIHFESVTREARLLNPLTNFELDRQLIEHRCDPLTGRTVMVLKGRLDYVKRYLESDQSAVDELADSTKQGCPFCPESVQVRSPRFPSEISADGRIYVGESVCFPSLFAHWDYNAIVVPTRAHKVTLNQLNPLVFTDAFSACVEYFSRVHQSRPEVKTNAVVMNFYPPAGSTIAHPHMQALASDLPIQATDDLLKTSAEYLRKHGVSYWADLVQTEERLRARYLGKLGRVHWLTPFAPSGLNESQAILPGVSSLSSASRDDLEDVSKGIVRILEYYYETGLRAFNFAIYSGPFGEDCDYFDLNLRIVSRYGYKPRFVSDVWTLQYLLGEQEVYDAPEETCSKLKRYFE